MLEKKIKIGSKQKQKKTTDEGLICNGSGSEVHETKTTCTTRAIRLSKASSIQLNTMLQSGLLQNIVEVGVLDS